MWTRVAESMQSKNLVPNFLAPPTVSAQSYDFFPRLGKLYILDFTLSRIRSQMSGVGCQVSFKKRRKNIWPK